MKPALLVALGSIVLVATIIVGSSIWPEPSWQIRLLSSRTKPSTTVTFGIRRPRCSATRVQRVRDLVLAEGCKEAFAADIAAYAWNVSYFLGDPSYGTARCRNGGPLDLHPGSAV